MALHTETITTTNTREIPPNTPSSREVTTIQLGLATIPVVFVIVLAFIFFQQVKYRKNLYHQLVTSKRYSSIPCHKCEFFDNNHHLPCAVQPTLVMSLEAVNCSDYSPKPLKVDK